MSTYYTRVAYFEKQFGFLAHPVVVKRVTV